MSTYRKLRLCAASAGGLLQETREKVRWRVLRVAAADRDRHLGEGPSFYDESVQLNVLGPLELRMNQVAGGPLLAVGLGPANQRVVLALLAMHADPVVPDDTIVDAVWTDRAPLI